MAGRNDGGAEVDFGPLAEQLDRNQRLLVEMGERLTAVERERDALRQRLDEHRVCEIEKEVIHLDQLNDRLVQALRKAACVIRSWHGKGPAWDIYYKNAPEMQPIRDALAGSGRAGMDLNGYTLDKLLEATRIMVGHEKKTPAGTEITTVCAERLVAAIYAWAHFEPSNEPIVIGRGKALLVVKVTEP